MGWYIIKMNPELFDKALKGTIETIFDEQNQPLFKRARKVPGYKKYKR